MSQTKTFFQNYWGYVALFAWIAIAVLIDFVRLSPFALDEEAARGLLLTWTVADNVINPIVIFGMPDFRALIYIPIGAYWPGNLLAAKILSLTISFVGVAMLYRWARRTSDSESALLASVLFILSPILITQTDSLSAGPYILLGFALGAWLDNAYRKNDNYFGGWYFSQMLWVAILATMHPIGLAYPLALAWNWYKNPHATKKPRHMYIGLAISMFLAVVMHRGWSNIEFFGNPFEALATALQGSIIWSAADLNWAPGIIAGVLLILLILADFKTLSKDLLGKMLLTAILFGTLIPDLNWALVVIAFIAYRGTHHIIRFNQSRNKHGFIGQRGIAAVVGLVVLSFFMVQDKNHALTIRHAILAPVDELIQSMMIEADDDGKPFRVASEWPGRMMIATKRDALPLPPAFEDPEEMLRAVKSVTHIAFNPFSPENQPLADAIGNLGGETETLALYQAGAIIRVRDSNVPMTTQQRLATEKVNKKNAEKLNTDTAEEAEDKSAE